MVAAVKKSFEEYPIEKLANVFLTLQSVFESSMEVKGGNNFEIQHKRKYGLTVEQKMLFNLECDKDIYIKMQNFSMKNRDNFRKYMDKINKVVLHHQYQLFISIPFHMRISFTFLSSFINLIYHEL